MPRLGFAIPRCSSLFDLGMSMEELSSFETPNEIQHFLCGDVGGGGLGTDYG